VNIANRAYPLTIKPEEEEDIRAAVKHIEEAVKRFEERYSVQDKQDVLAMCAFANCYPKHTPTQQKSARARAIQHIYKRFE